MQASRTRSHAGNSSPGNKLSREIQAIKHGVAELRADVTELMGHVLGVGSGGAEAVKQTAFGAVESVKDGLADIKQRGLDQVSDVRRRIQASPFKATLIAFGVGYILAKLTSRR
jgi:hypothetical protein